MIHSYSKNVHGPTNCTSPIYPGVTWCNCG
nr:MAG TPA: hypothetical protein [Caudoviricetes sp.]